MPLKNYFQAAMLTALTALLCGCSGDDDPASVTLPEAYAVVATELQARILTLSNLPSGKIIESAELSIIQVPNAFSAVGISPESNWCAVATFDSSATDARMWQTSLTIYDLNKDLMPTVLNKQDLRNAVNFPNSDASMHIRAIGWENDSTLIVHLKPRIDFLPIGTSNISWRYEITQGSTLETLPSPSGAPFSIPFPEWQQKSLYTFDIANGQAIIEGQVLAGISGVQHLDVSFLDVP